MDILDFLFPKFCLGCHKKGDYFCPSCVQTTKRVAQVCPSCEKPSPFGQTHPLCQSKYSLDGLFSFFTYEGMVKNAIHELKYKLVTDLVKDFWQIILKDWQERIDETTLIDHFIEQEKPLIVPIPLYWYKENFRGFNQATLFGKKLAQRFKLPFSDKIILRKKNVPSQTKLSQKERLKNVQGIFSISPKVYELLFPIVHGSLFNILLVDDVWTTGATLKEATKVLKGSGFKRVWGLTIAR